MPERGFDTGFWTDPSVFSQPALGKLLLAYLKNNDHCNQAGVYRIGIKIIASETGIPEATLPDLLRGLEGQVKWLVEHDLVWVKDFVATQAKSPKFLIAAAKCLGQIHNNGLAAEVVEYNQAHYSISIPYQYSMDRVTIPPRSRSNTISNSIKEKGGQGGRNKKTEDTSEGLGVVARLYEENIGKITPMVAERLKDAEKQHSAEWVTAAIGEAVKNNARKLSYIEAVLQNWKVNGFGAKPRTGKKLTPGVLPGPEEVAASWEQ